MSLTCGFYDSLNGDRKYSANQLSSIFDGIIKDGVFDTDTALGEIQNSCFAITAIEGTMGVLIGTGKAWFNHTWTINDATYPITFEDSELLMDRIDAIVLEINKDPTVRTNTLKIIKGTQSDNPTKPEMLHTDTINQYALAYVRIPAISEEITQSNIEYVVGTEETPYITALMETASIDAVVEQWNAQFSEWRTEEENIFRSWFDTIKVILDGDVATRLAEQILTVDNKTIRAYDVPIAIWAPDTTYEDYPFRASIAIAGVTADYSADVRFDMQTLLDNDICPVTNTATNAVYIYASEMPETSFTIPVIICDKVK